MFRYLCAVLIVCGAYAEKLPYAQLMLHHNAPIKNTCVNPEDIVPSYDPASTPISHSGLSTVSRGAGHAATYAAHGVGHVAYGTGQMIARVWHSVPMSVWVAAGLCSCVYVGVYGTGSPLRTVTSWLSYVPLVGRLFQEDETLKRVNQVEGKVDNNIAATHQVQKEVQSNNAHIRHLQGQVRRQGEKTKQQIDHVNKNVNSNNVKIQQVHDQMNEYSKQAQDRFDQLDQHVYEQGEALRNELQEQSKTHQHKFNELKKGQNTIRNSVNSNTQKLQRVEEKVDTVEKKIDALSELLQQTHNNTLQQQYNQNLNISVHNNLGASYPLYDTLTSAHVKNNLKKLLFEKKS